MAYIIEPFLSDKRESLNSHTHFWESYHIGQTYRDLGFIVDVIDYRNDAFMPRRKYDLFVSARSNFQIIANRLNDDCYKVVHLDTSHWMFNNQAAYTRYLSLQKRRKATIKMRKVLDQNWAIESADCATLLGNEWTSTTYQYGGKTIFQLPVPTCKTYPFPEDKNFDMARTNFLWMGSDGFVNKGLDLVLEVFASLPDLKLYVCGPIENEQDFKTLYRHELYQLDNITTLGWVDVASDQFVKTTNQCASLVYPSCAEGQAGAVATCMQAGLIPAISRESGFQVQDFGFMLLESSMDEIKDTVKRIACSSSEDLYRRAKSAWHYARTFHSREKYKKVYQNVAEAVVNELIPDKRSRMAANGNH